MVVCTRKSRRLREVDESVSSSAMANLPSHILIEIISRLPIKTVMSVRCVSKSLLNLVSEPYFKELYSTRAPTEVFLHDYTQKNMLYIADPVLHEDYPVAVDLKFSLVSDLPRFSVTFKNVLNFRVKTVQLSLVNTCNGLVCYHGPYGNMFVVICNPVTGEYVTIPRPDSDVKTGDIHRTFYGFGFSPKNNRFKLLRMLRWNNVGAVKMFYEIYTFGESGSWKSVANCPDISLSFLSGNCLFYEGVLHWYSLCSGDIVTFDVDNDKFGKISPPYIWAREMERDARLDVLGDCLYKTASVGDCVQVWVMKEYGVQSSWIKAFSIQKHIWYSSRDESYKPIKYLQNGEILMLLGCKIVCYNQDTTSIRIIGSASHGGGYKGLEAISMRPTLVSLKVLLGDNVKSRNAKSRGAPSPRKHREVDVTPPWLTRIALIEDTTRQLRLMQLYEERARRDPLLDEDYYERKIQEFMKLLDLCDANQK